MRDEAFTEALYGTHDGKRPLGKRRPRLKDKTTMISKNMEICQLISLRSKKKKGPLEILFEHPVSRLNCGYLLTILVNISFGITGVFQRDMPLLTYRNSLEKHGVS